MECQIRTKLEGSFNNDMPRLLVAVLSTCDSIVELAAIPVSGGRKFQLAQ